MKSLHSFAAAATVLAASLVQVGCAEPVKPAKTDATNAHTATTPAHTATPPANPVSPATPPAGGPGSTTGAGTEVPAPVTPGTTETPAPVTP